MPEVVASEKPPITELPPQRPFDRMQDFLRKNGRLVYLTLEDTSGAEVEIMLLRKHNVQPLAVDFLSAIKSGVFMSKIPEGYEIDLMITQRKPVAPDAVPADITGQFIIVNQQEKPKTSEKTAKTSVEGTEILSFRLSGDPQEQRQATLATKDWHHAKIFLNLSKTLWQKHGDELYWTESQREIEKIVYGIPTTPELPESPNLRKLLKFAAMATGATMIGLLPDAKIMDLKTLIEKRFGVQLRTIAELHQEFPEIYQRYMDIGVINPPGKEHLRWNDHSLNSLQKALSLLPNHFYKPDNQGRPVLIVSAEQSGECVCGNLDHPYPHAIMLNLGQGKDTNVDTLVHELTHLLTLGYVPNKEGVHRWYLLEQYDKINEILGVKFEEISRQLRVLTSKKFSPLVNADDASKASLESLPVSITVWSPKKGLTPQELEKFEFYKTFLHSVGPQSGPTGFEEPRPTEFIANLAQHFVHGKDYFKKHYGEFFEPEIVERLYGFVKDDIFRGREY